jgi:hypothetical protein
LYDVRFANDWVVSRTGWDERSSVLALRSGPPANHEHADRNSVIFKAYGERLLHDPFKAAYSHTLPHWLLRQTEAHTAVLIDGRGHQYHDGKEGTNASWADAQIVAYNPTGQHLVVTSDATEAYRLVNPQVDLARRTLIFLKPEVLLIFDRIRLQSTPARVQLRFQVYNEDGKGIVKITKDGFFIERPLANLKGSVVSSNSITLRNGTLDVPEDVGIYPYLEAETSAALEHMILTVCTAQEKGKPHGNLAISQKGSIWDITGRHNQRSLAVEITVDNELPIVTIGT